jgi:energy-coupling factor transporter ATP-binding protein EcfA2
MKESTTANVQESKIKALVFGPTGSGKTSTALTLKPETTLIISAESGLLPLAGKPFTVWEIEQFSEMMEVVYMRLLDPEMQKKFKVIFVDSLTEINELAKDRILTVDRPGLKKDIGKVYEELLMLQDYQLLSTKLIGMIRAFRDLPYHIIFTCMEAQSKNEKTGEVFVTPSVNGKLAMNLGGYFDEVFRMKVKQIGDKMEYYFVTGLTEGAIGKDRSGALNLYEPASWSVVFKKIFNKFDIKEGK